MKDKSTHLEKIRSKLENIKALAWVVIFAGLLVSAAGVLSAVSQVHKFFTPDELSDRERVAVFSLIEDLRRTPLFLSIFYQQPHTFIDSSWDKVNPENSYYESSEDAISIFDLANRVGRHRDRLRFFESRVGTKVVRISDVDSPAGFDTQVTAILVQPQKPAELDLQQLSVVSTSPYLLPKLLSVRGSDLYVPGNLRAALNQLNSKGELMSLTKVLRSSRDFMLVSESTRRDPNDD